jgi:hypothetical protein
VEILQDGQVVRARTQPPPPVRTTPPPSMKAVTPKPMKAVKDDE